MSDLQAHEQEGKIGGKKAKKSCLVIDSTENMGGRGFRCQLYLLSFRKDKS